MHVKLSWQFRSANYGIAVTLAISIAISGAASEVRAADPHDSDTIMSIYARSLKLTEDIVDNEQGALDQARASGNMQTVECLHTLQEASSSVSSALNDVSDLANVASMLRDPFDENYALTVRNSATKSALKILALNRTMVNKMAGVCPSQILVEDKTHELIDLIDEGTTELSVLLSGGR